MIKRTFKITAGIICIIIGLFGFLVPIMPGWPFIIVGAVLIKPSHKEKILAWLESIKEKIKRKHK